MSVNHGEGEQQRRRRAGARPPSGGAGFEDRRAGQVDRDEHVYERRRREQRRRRARRERAAFDPAPPSEDDWVVGSEDDDALRRIGPPAAVGEALEGFIRARGWEDRLRGADLWSRWPEIAGEHLAEHCEPVRLAGGILVLRVESQVWATQIRYLQGQLRENADRVLGPGSVREVRTVIGPLGTEGQA